METHKEDETSKAFCIHGNTPCICPQCNPAITDEFFLKQLSRQNTKEEWETDVKIIDGTSYIHYKKVSRLLTHQKQSIMDMCDEIGTDPEANDVTDHFIADDAYESKVEAFWYGYNQALSDLTERIGKL